MTATSEQHFALSVGRAYLFADLLAVGSFHAIRIQKLHRGRKCRFLKTVLRITSLGHQKKIFNCNSDMLVRLEWVKESNKQHSRDSENSPILANFCCCSSFVSYQTGLYLSHLLLPVQNKFVTEVRHLQKTFELSCLILNICVPPNCSLRHLETCFLLESTQNAIGFGCSVNLSRSLCVVSYWKMWTLCSVKNTAKGFSACGWAVWLLTIGLG